MGMVAYLGGVQACCVYTVIILVHISNITSQIENKKERKRRPDRWKSWKC